MERIVRFKRNWEESFIRICIIDNSVVEIDVPLSIFVKRFFELIEIPRFIFPWMGKKKIMETVSVAFDKTVKELKEETIHV